LLLIGDGMNALDEDRFAFQTSVKCSSSIASTASSLAAGSRMIATVPLAGSVRASSSIRAPPSLLAKWRECLAESGQLPQT